MAQCDLSILIPARNEMFLSKTVENILENIEGNTEIIVTMDGTWADPGIVDNPRVIVIHYSESIGQRAATNQAARLSKAKYIMKCDAHCAFDKGFDVKMMAEIHDDWTMVPVMKNLHAFDWVCPDGHRRYQGPSGPCQASLPDGQVCGKETSRDVVWTPKPSPNSVSYCFDSAPHFQYFGAYAKRAEGQGEITETMSLQGSCWMMTRDKYWELDVCDEAFGSWGSQGIEVAVKTWLSGGRVMVNKKTWYAHMFRTQGGDFGFPYPISGSAQEKAKAYARDLFFNNKWDKQVRPLSWLVEKFWPVPGWTEEDLNKLRENTFSFSDKPMETKSMEIEPEESLPRTERYWGEPTNEEEVKEVVIFDASQDTNTEHSFSLNQNAKLVQKPTKGIIFYTDNAIKIKIGRAVQKQLQTIGFIKQIPIVSSSLKEMAFGVKNIALPDLKKNYKSRVKQILAALEASEADIIFFCENNVLYHPSHFDFMPPDKNIFYYNQNVWMLRTTDGHALHYDTNELSGLCVYREAAITHFKERYEMIKKALSGLSREDFRRFLRNLGITPMTHGRIKWENMYHSGTWKSEFPNIDIKHEGNLAGQRWKKDQFRNQKLLVNWQETDDEIPGWGKTKELIKNFN